MPTLLELAYEAVDSKKAEDIVVLNMEGISLIADQFIICHANSERQVQAIAREVADAASKEGYPVKRLKFTFIRCIDIYFRSGTFRRRS